MNNLFLTLIFLGTYLQLTAGTVSWDGGAASTEWENPLNWVGDALPTASDDVDINSATVVLAANTQVQRVYVRGSGHLTVNSGVTLTIDGFSGDDGLEINTSATLINNGTIAVSNISGSGSDGIFIKGNRYQWWYDVN